MECDIHHGTGIELILLIAMIFDMVVKPGL